MFDVKHVRSKTASGVDVSILLRRSRAHETVALSNGEFNLLTAFLAAPQQILSREQLLDLSRLHNDEVYDRSIDVQVSRLRKKIQPEGARARLIRTERGAGYVFTAPVETVR